MTHENANTARRLLHRSDAMDAQLYTFGREGLSIQAAAAELGCHKDTLRNFFAREPEARQIFWNGRNEVQADAADAHRSAARAVQSQGSFKASQINTCPHCGKRYDAPVEESIIISKAAMDRAREKLDALYRKHQEHQDRQAQDEN